MSLSFLGKPEAVSPEQVAAQRGSDSLVWVWAPEPSGCEFTGSGSHRQRFSAETVASLCDEMAAETVATAVADVGAVSKDGIATDG